MLILIDLQDFFLCQYSWRDRLIEAVANQCRRAISRHEWIVRVEMDGFGDTVDSLMKELEGYDRCLQVKKSTPSGAAAILARAAELGLAFDTIKVCGLYKNLCVKATVIGLWRKLKKRQIFVIEEACDPGPLVKDWDKALAEGYVVAV
jgi:nicotinamidase-related amidase